MVLATIPSAELFSATLIKFFFILTPFFVLSMFIVMTDGMTQRRQRRIAEKTTVAILVICFFFYFLGNYTFELFGITLDAFRIGAGAILFLTGVNLVMDRDKDKDPEPAKVGDISVAPLAIPFAVGPGTIGTIMVISAESHGWQEHLAACLGIGIACLATGLLLFGAGLVERLIGKGGIHILSKLTGLILAALAAQMIFTGVKNFLR